MAPVWLSPVDRPRAETSNSKGPKDEDQERGGEEEESKDRQTEKGILTLSETSFQDRIITLGMIARKSITRQRDQYFQARKAPTISALVDMPFAVASCRNESSSAGGQSRAG